MVFVTEFSAMKMGTDTLRGMRYKLIMISAGIDIATHGYGDNMYV